MSKHTPGSWHRVGRKIYGPHPKDPDKRIREVAVVQWDRGTYSQEADANAALIAEAPDLLEDLQYRYEQSQCGCRHPACKNCDDDRYTLELLSKAKGETE